MSRVAGEVVHLVHGLGLLGVVLGAVAYPALALAGRRRGRRVLRRGALLLAVDPGKRRRRRSVPGARVRDLAALLGAVATGWILVGGPLGCAAGLAAAYCTWRWQRTRDRRRPGVPAAEAAETAQQLPLAADLLAACISAGAGPREAAEAVGESLGGPVGERLARTAAEIRLGGEPAVYWGRFGEIPGAGALARCLERAGSTGAPAAEPVSRLAEAMRAERSSAAVARAQRAGVLITAPVGLCFLPAFLAVGVAPVVIGLATGLLHTG
ncbi:MULTISPECIES: type II secretion system F family protein [unclassified Streptomyces]|uniref:type II secretion system F family protein n=1 Tax=unclassified Streptomyces TaxID=2593676 RepID=UPI002DD868D2|nr:MULTISPECIES: type II secretion system F family protein [unclassified Streptomyces]WSC37762.1 type II secretion system F family protein [Streptomyces sp. NBC_01763]WSD25539.1 type II secretion system F family protein [Streptomyces sp. NBC_01751]